METMGIIAVLLTASNNLCWHAFGYLCINLAQTWYDDRYYCTLRFDTSLSDLDLNSRSQECEQVKSSAPIGSQSLDDFDFHSRSQLCKKSKTLVYSFSQIKISIRMKFSMLPQPVGLLKLLLNFLCTSNIQGRELCCCDLA